MKWRHTHRHWRSEGIPVPAWNAKRKRRAIVRCIFATARLTGEHTRQETSTGYVENDRVYFLCWNEYFDYIFSACREASPIGRVFREDQPSPDWRLTLPIGTPLPSKMVPSMTLTYLNLWQISRILVLVYPVFVMPQYLQCASSDKLVELTKANYPRAGNSTVWGECNLPNPRQRWELCGRHGPSWICDPDGLLSSEEGKSK